MTVKSLISESSEVLRDVMQDNLRSMAAAIVKQIMAKMKSLTPSQYGNAIKDLPSPGVMDYKDSLLTAISIVTAAGISSARKEVPTKRPFKFAEEESIVLGEWDKLPPKIRKKVLQQAQLLVATQVQDLQKALIWQHTSSVGSTDSMTQLQFDLELAAKEYIEGNSIRGAAEVTAGRAVNESRVAFFTDTDAIDEVAAFQFINGDPVTQICNDLAGTVFDVNDPGLDRYMPPLHWGCKSYIIPILKGKLGNRELTKLQPSSKRIEDTIQFADAQMHSCCSCPASGKTLIG